MNKGSVTEQSTYPTSFPEVNTVVGELLSRVQSAIGNHFVGMYLYGSLATGDFNPEQSDIDFVIVTIDSLASEMVQSLEILHARLAARGSAWAKLEGAYVPQNIIRRHDRQHAPCPSINEGQFYLAYLGEDWVIQRYVLREYGLVVAGPDPETLIDPVGPGDLQRAVQGFLREWWAPMLQKPDARLHGAEYQAYTVLTMCRAAYTSRKRAIVSKSRAAQWAQDTFGGKWSELIEWALRWHGAEQARCITEVLDFVRYTLEHNWSDEPSI